MKKVRDLIETFTLSLQKASEPVPLPSPTFTEEILQEKLKFENELQALKSTMNREMEEERAFLRQDREAFEKMVNQQAKLVSHVGELEDEEDKELALEKKSKGVEEQQKALKSIEASLHQEMKDFKENFYRSNVGTILILGLANQIIRKEFV